MNAILPPAPVASASAHPAADLSSDSMAVELLALHEEMILQLRQERLAVVGSARFLTGLIDTQEKIAALLRAKLAHCQTDFACASAIFITGEASSAAAKADVTQCVQGARGTRSVRNYMTVKN